MHYHSLARSSQLSSFASSVVRRRSTTHGYVILKKNASTVSSPLVVAKININTNTNTNIITTSASCHSYGGKQVIQVNQALYEYVLAHTREPQVSPDQGQFLAMLVQLMGAKQCIEVGVYTGYSSLAVALVLPECGHLVCCERDQVSLDVAQKYFGRAGVLQKVHVYLGMAIDTLNMLLSKGQANSYDFAFLDADKKLYRDYYELLLQLVRPGGLVVIDNVLWHGKVADSQETDTKTESLRRFNNFVKLDTRVDVSMVPVGDGMTLCRKRCS